LKNKPEHEEFKEFSVLSALLSKPDPSFDLVTLAFEAAKFCSKSQLEQLTEQLKGVCTTDNIEFTELRLRSAELSLHEKDFDSARVTLMPLKQDSRLHKTLLDFYTRVAWNSEKQLFLEQHFQTSLAQVAQEGLTPALVQSLETLMEMLKLCSIKPDRLPYRKGWVKNAQDQSEHPERLYHLDSSSTKVRWLTISTNEPSPQAYANAISGTLSYYALCELSNGNILASGGIIDGSHTTAVTEIDHETLTPTRKAPMHLPRYYHGSVLLEGKVYAIGGSGVSSSLHECEAYDWDADSWEMIASLPQNASYITPIVLEETRCIYVLGGYIDESDENKNSIQVFSLESSTWRVLTVSLPNAEYSVPCFKLNRKSTEIYFSVGSMLYKLHTLEERLETLKSASIPSNTTFGQCYYSRGRLFIPAVADAVQVIDIGPLN
jgi:hypothetical protein